MNKSTRYSAEVRERAVRLVFEYQGEYESQWAAMDSIAAKIGCTAETLRIWVRRTEACRCNRRTAGAHWLPLWRLGCPKIFHEVAAHVRLAMNIAELRGTTCMSFKFIEIWPLGTRGLSMLIHHLCARNEEFRC